MINDSDSYEEQSEKGSHRGADSHRGLSEQQEVNQYQEQENEEIDSNKSDNIDDGSMNVFGFNDDLNLDDRIIVQNATDN